MEKSEVFIKNLDKIMKESSRWGFKDTEISFSDSNKTSDKLKKEDLNIRKISEKYIKDKNTIESLNSYIMSSDKALDSLESYLFCFRKDLNEIDNEIKALQFRSIVLDQQLQIRKDTEKRVKSIVDESIISPEMIYCISELKIDEKWQNNLSILNNILEKFNINKKNGNISKIQEYMEKELEKLSLIAAERIREFFINKIKILHNPCSNSKAIQQCIINYKFLFNFLYKNQKQLTFDIKQTYQNTMQWYYSYNFERYTNFLEKLKINIFDTFALDSEKASKKNNIHSQKGISIFSSYKEFNISHRASIVLGEDQNIIITRISNHDKKIYNLEIIFYSYNQVLINNIIIEHFFLSEFMLFNSQQELNNYLQDIIKSTLSNSMEFNQQLIRNSYNVLDILLCIKVAEKLISILKNKEISILDNYMNEILELLWNQFQNSIDLHSENLNQLSIKNTLLENYNRTSPDIVTQIFGDLLNGIFILFSQDYNELIETNVEKLVNSYKIYLTKINNKIKSEEQKQFLHNNYSLILTIIGNTKGYLAKKQQEHFHELQVNIGKS
ncbi:hypothetical protein T552_00703 [Pneumocystis carinii B80]|uniref:Uncharacterized protein n=1 Tax=Pneumocystis carinii (strain B80) TaxID=1408658 RepID=A0A0W4ZPE4_PNEC8|nr:hypothetical protein T552_00703 [Pneumocystis carinii B80]KTW30225.1 hypothetical protein T552_00703 [Pneumocystis carinii B80]